MNYEKYGIPANGKVEGSLNLAFSDIEKLPDNLSVKFSLDLMHCMELTMLPDNLNVGRLLDLEGCTGLTALPDGLKVGNLDLTGTNLKNVAYRKNCGIHNRTIFAAFVNGEIQIGAGCFLGSVADFNEAVDEKYPELSAEKYKLDAHECVKELQEILAKKAA